jgi:CubicO group peptidase (beta-lactamase class C family)
MTRVRFPGGSAAGLSALVVGLMVGSTAVDLRRPVPSLLAASSAQQSVESLDAMLDAARGQHNIPALGAIVFRADSVLARGIVGVQRSNDPTPVRLTDRFQLGSNTKAMTATLLATFVEQGKLAWTTTLAEVFPEQREKMSADFRGVTIDLLLSHHAGIAAFEDTDSKEFKSIPRLSGTPAQQRAAFTEWVLRGKPAGPVGKGLYSNGAYTVAGVVAERIGGESWESLLRVRVFKPLDIDGTYAWSSAPDLNQPWGHHETRTGAKPVNPLDPNERLPPIIWPAGSVELSLDDYARFLQINLRGLQGHDTPLLKAETIKHLHTSPVTPPDKYGLGWGLQDFDGAPSSVHVGSAGTFYAVTIIQPTRDLGAAVFVNAGAERATAAATDTIKALIRRFAVTSPK